MRPRRSANSTGVRSIGLVGTRFGASCALLAAPGVAADRLVLIAPAVRGVHFLRELVRAGAVIELTGSAGPDDTPDAWSALKARRIDQRPRVRHHRRPLPVVRRAGSPDDARVHRLGAGHAGVHRDSNLDEASPSCRIGSRAKARG